MPMIAALIQKQAEAALASALTKAFSAEAGANAEAIANHTKMAAAIAEGIIPIIVMAIQTSAEVAPGILTAGSPAAQVTTTPGKIL